jgi:hypothetical protein
VSSPVPGPSTARAPALSAARPPPGPPPWTKNCGSCRRIHSASEWQVLPVVESLPPSVVQSHLSVPALWEIELRRCPCGATLAARRR